MRALRGMVWMMVGVGLVLPMVVREAQADAQKLNRVIIYPGDGDSLATLKQSGVRRVDDYGSYWITEATDEQLKTLQQKHGDRLQKADQLNKIELQSATIDITTGEPVMPQRLKEQSVAGKRLRLVQFVGPVQPGWLEQLKAAGKVKVVNYVPNNAYVVLLDAAAEAKLQALRQPAGPIQWIGAYHPYYKMNKSLQKTTKATVRVRLAIVNDADATAAIAAVKQYALGPVSEPRYLLDQINLELTLQLVDLETVAGLPSVLWLREVMPLRRFDEPQALVLATSDSGPAPSTYLDFLQNKVGVSQNPEDYPVLDIADSGLDKAPPFVGCASLIIGGRIINTWHPAFYLPSFPVSPDAQCCFLQTLRVVYRDQDDTDGHGTIVASVAAGFDDLPDEIINCYTEARAQICTSNTVFGCFTNGFTIGGDIQACQQVPRPPCCDTQTCTNWNITCGYTTNVVCTNSCEVVTNRPAPPFPVRLYRREPGTGLQLGLGISPYGRIGASRGGAEPGFAGPFNHGLNAYLRAARISNNSWGEILEVGGNDGGYDDLSQAYDALVRDAVLTGSTNPPTPGPSPVNQELIYVFAGGNANGIDGTGGFGDVLVTPPATAKNVFTVGASTKEDPGALAAFTSFGPTADGRFKPEIMAPGVNIYGATSQASYTQRICGGCDPNNPFPPCSTGYQPDPIITKLYSDFENGLTLYSGTSFSAPAVSGAAQLLWWYFQNRLLMLQPSPAMIKAYICNAARYMPTPNPLTGTTDQLPSSAQGMGRLDLDRMFDTVPRVIRDESIGRAIDSPLLTTNPVTQQTYFNQSGQSYELSGTVADSTKPLRFTLAWTDVPGTPGNGPQLVNNLDLLVSVGGRTYYGNVFNREFSKTGGTPDVLNNMESVFLPPGQTGTWSVVVRAVNIAGKGVPNVGTTVNQDFALVVYNGVNGSDVPNPVTNDTCQTATEIGHFPFAWTNNLSPAVYHNNHPSPSAGRGGIEEFFSITFPTPGTVLSANTFGSNFNTLLSVWRGTCGGLEEVTSNNDASNTLQSAVSWLVTDTNTYYLVVEGLQNKTGKVVLNVSAKPPPFPFEPAVLNFGTNYVGTSSNLTVRLHNQTTVHANIADVTIDGPNAGDFAITAENCAQSSLPPDGSCDITVTFSPTAPGVRSATLFVADDVTGNPHTLALTGFGLAQAPLFCASVPGGLTFGTVPVGLTSTVQSITITNCGTTNMFITAVTVSGAAAGDFIAIGGGCSNQTIAAGGVCSNSIIFVPQAVGARTATLVFGDDSSDGPHSFALTGTGKVRAPAVCLSTSALSFGNVTVGLTGVLQSVTVSNCGSADLFITNVFVTGVAATNFIIVSSTCSNRSIEPAGTCKTLVRFAPTAIAAASASLQIDDSAAGSPHTVALSGFGVGSQPDASISRLRNRRYVGGNIFNSTGEFQEVIQKGLRNRKCVFYVKLQNDGNATDQFLVQGTGDVPGFLTVRYFLGAFAAEGLDITDAVKAGTYSTASLAGGAVTGNATRIRVVVKVDRLALAGTNSVLITATSSSNLLKTDAVKATVRVR